MTFHKIRFRSIVLVSSIALSVTVMSQAQAGALLSQDFNRPNAWPQLSSLPVPDGTGLQIRVDRGLVGTIDVAESTTPSGAALLTVSPEPRTAKAWAAGLTSGLLPVKTTETNLGKLTLSFDHSVSSVRPVTVKIESFNAKKKRTGGLESVVYPAAADFYLRAALDLSTMQAFGEGTFRPTDPYVKLTFQMESLPDGAKDDESAKLRIDNIAYASPAYYVSPHGKDTNDGRTEKTAFADPQKAVNAARPGDIILLMDGTYHRAPTSSIQEGVIGFHHSGTPAAWITVKNYPNQHPILTSDGWSAVCIGRGSSEVPTKEPVLAYLEVRGLHVLGNALTAKQQIPQEIGKSTPSTNGNGLNVDGRYEMYKPHHIRFADNLVEYCCGGGIGAGAADWITIENNISRNNAWWTIYACSGISLLTVENFDGVDNQYRDLIRNNVVSGNRCFIAWEAVKKISDGNGIIIDSNYIPEEKKSHRGRTLVQNNVSFNNGGSGIHAYRSHRVDIINNTAYYNGASPELQWGQIFVQRTDDVHLINNILVARPGQPINSIGPDSGDQDSTNVVRYNNLYFGGLTPKLTGDGDLFADPQFVNASTDEKTANFHLRVGSPALQSGWQGLLVPLRDLDGKPRPRLTAPDRGPYQK